MAIESALDRYRALNAFNLPWETGLYLPESETDDLYKRYGLAQLVYREIADADSIRTLIRKGIVYGMSRITQANGYSLTLGDQNILKTSSGQFINYPAINVVFGRETYLSSEGRHAIGYLPKRLMVDFEVTVKSIDDIRTDEMKAIRDIEYYFLQNMHLPDETGTGYCIGHIRFFDNRIVGSESDYPYGKVIVPMEITYLQSQLSPYANTISSTTTAYDDDLPEAVSISKRDDIVKAIKYNLESVTIANDYKNTIHASDTIKSINDMPNKPFINIMPENEEYISIGKVMVKKNCNFRLLCFLGVVEDPLTYQESVIADIEKKLVSTFYLPDADGKRTAITSILTYNQIKGMDEDMPFYGVEFGFKVSYQQLLTDPAKQTES